VAHVGEAAIIAERPEMTLPSAVGRISGAVANVSKFFHLPFPKKKGKKEKKKKETQEQLLDNDLLGIAGKADVKGCDANVKSVV
jgi:hypothetical protein